MCFAVQANENQLEVIEVSAQKRVQSLQSVPIAITAISENDLSLLQLNEASEVVGFAPNVNMTRSIGGVYNYFIRGVGLDDFNLSSVSAVGLYIDDVAIQNPVLANFAMLDVARVEILRGPQNTLYGKNTTGGAINFLTMKPSIAQETLSSVSFDVGSDKLRRVKLRSLFSLNDDIAMGVSVFQEKRDGQVSAAQIENDSQFNNSDKLGFRFTSVAQIAQDTELTLAFYGGDQNQISEVKTLLIADPETGLINIDNFNLDKVSSALRDPQNDIETYGGYAKLQWSNGHYVLSSITSFEDVRSARKDDWGSQSLTSGIYQVITFNSSDTRAYAQELRLLSPVTDTGHWLLGVLVNNQTGDILQTAYIDPAGPGRPDDAIDDAGVGPLFDRGAWVASSSLTASVYGHQEFNINQDLTVSLGLRWAMQKLSPLVHSAGMLMDDDSQPFPLGTFGWYSLGNNGFDIFNDYAGFTTVKRFITANQGFPATAKIDETFREWGGKIAAQYDVTQKIMAYLSFARGFKMGAVNSNPSTATFKALLNGVVQPETLYTLETGIKSEWLNRRLRMNLAMFYNRWQDYQFFLVYNPGNPANLFASLVNLPAAETQGMELELTWQFSDDLRGNLGLGYLDAEVTDGQLSVDKIHPDFHTGFQSSVLTGDRLPNSPQWVANGILQKDFSFSFADITAILNYQFIDKHIHALAGANSEQWQQNFSEKAVGLWGFSVLLHPKHYPEVRFNLWGKNITDEPYCSERATIPGTPTDFVRLCAQGQYREFGLGLRMEF